MNQIFRISLLATLLLIGRGALSPLYPEGNEREGPSGCGNYLVIKGESNVNRFSFTYNGSTAGSGNMHASHQTAGTSEILIPVKQFEPSNPHMYNDFLLQLKENRYPYITIKLDDLGPEKRGEHTGQYSLHTVLITLAGVTRQYTIECIRINCGGKYIIKGIETLKLTDFNISPPKKLNGLIRVKNEITVNFSIMLNFTEENSYAISK